MMANELIQHATREMNDWTIWSVTGRIDTTTATGAGDTGEKILSNAKKVALDLSKVAYLSSAGLRVLLRLAKKAKSSGKEFALCAASGMVKDVLEESGMDMLVTIHDSLDTLK